MKMTTNSGPNTSEQATGSVESAPSTSSAPGRISNESPKPILFVNFESGGHHHQHICHLVRFGMKENGRMFRFLVPRRLRNDVLRELSPDAGSFFASRVDVLEEDPAWLRIRKRISNESLATWLFVESLNYRERKRSRLLFLHLESVLYPLAFSPLRRFAVSGLTARPMFHYKRAGFFVKAKDSQLLFVIKYLVARSFASRAGFEHIFVMDSWAHEFASSTWTSNRFRLLPDPYGPEEGESRPVASSEPVTERPLTLLIAGAMAPRKGIHSVVDALAATPETTRRNIRVRIVGKPEKGQADYVAHNLERLKELRMDVVADLRFVPDDQLDQCIAEAHAVVTPYIDHKSSSGILYRSAHFGVPIISTDRGLLGRLVAKHKLGAAIDTADPECFAKCLDDWVRTGRVGGFDPESARRLADESTPELFSQALFTPVDIS